MKIGFIIPLLDDYDIDVAYKNIEKACSDSEVDFEVVFALNNNLNLLFTKIRNNFVENNKVRAFKTDRPVNEHKLIAYAMEESEHYDAIVIYSGKEETNVDVMKAFITSWKAGNKIVYLKKLYRGFARFTHFLKNAFYKMGVALLGIFRDVGAENDIQLLDNDVVKTINQLPHKNQMLRTLDALIYNNTDIIHLEVDSNEFINPVYTEKGKGYTQNAIIGYSCLGVALITLTLASIFIAVELSMLFIIYLLLFTVSIVSLFMFVLFNTKKRLVLRAGNEFDMKEINSIKSKIEYYNFTN